MHKAVATLLIFMVVVDLCITIAGVYFKNVVDLPYLKGPVDEEVTVSSLFEDVYMIFIQNIVLFSHAIPMSIYVAIEVLKIMQVQMVYKDQAM